MKITEHENPNPNWLDLVFFFFWIDNRTFIEKKNIVHDDEHYGHEKDTKSSRAKANS